jgi:xanthine/uracil/vitamin C permease (AzgA family)
MTISMGVYGRFPIAIAAGLGLNGFLAFGLEEAFSEPAVQEAPKEGLGQSFDPLLSFSSCLQDVLWHSPN